MNPLVLTAVVALLPITALITVIQRRPFYALISRGMMGAVAALLYAVLGAPDVALTEALMGTLLTILLYLIAVRSSMMVKVGWLRGTGPGTLQPGASCDRLFDPIRRCCREHFLEPEFIPFEGASAMEDSLRRGRIDAVFSPGPGETESRGNTLLMARHADSLFRLFGQSFDEGGVRIRLMKPEEGPGDP